MNGVIKKEFFTLYEKKFFTLYEFEAGRFSLGIGKSITVDACIDLKNWKFGMEIGAQTECGEVPRWRDYSFSLSFLLFHFCFEITRFIGNKSKEKP